MLFDDLRLKFAVSISGDLKFNVTLTATWSHHLIEPRLRAFTA